MSILSLTALISDAGPYSLSAVKKFAGRQGEGYSADLLEDGVVIAKVTDEANGGALRMFWLADSAMERDATRERVKAYVKTLPPSSYRTEFEPVENFVGELFDLFERLKSAARVCAKKTAYSLKSAPPDQYQVINEEYSPQIKTWLEKKYGEDLCEIFNEVVDAAKNKKAGKKKSPSP